MEVAVQAPHLVGPPLVVEVGLLALVRELQGEEIRVAVQARFPEGVRAGVFQSGPFLPVEGLRILEDLPPGVATPRRVFWVDVGHPSRGQVTLDAVHHRATLGGVVGGLLPGGCGLRVDMA